MDFENLSPEFRERARACKTVEEVFALAKEEGLELTTEQIEGISAGWCQQHACTGFCDMYVLEM